MTHLGASAVRRETRDETLRPILPSTTDLVHGKTTSHHLPAVAGISAEVLTRRPKAWETSRVPLSDETPKPVVAAFDLDGTLTEGGSVFRWLRWIAGARRTYAAALRLAVPLTVGAVRSGRAADNAKERLFMALLAGRSEAQVTEDSREFILEHLGGRLRPKALARLRWHLEAGHDVVIVSASPQMYVNVVADQLGAHGALGTRLAADPLGHLTGGYLGRNCRGAEKMRRFNDWISERRYPEEPIVFAYGNSRGDRRLLRLATHPFNAGKLGRLGSLRRYPRLTSEPPTTA